MTDPVFMLKTVNQYVGADDAGSGGTTTAEAASGEVASEKVGLTA
jgi:hypothetical protein